jgi:integrase
MIETWLGRLVDRKRLSNKSADNILSILSVMLEEARRQGLAKTNPCREVRPFAKNMKVRGIFTIDEARRLLTTPSLWDNPVAYAASLLAACTGMRLGEVRALRACDIRDGYIHVEHSVDLHGNLKSTKTGDVRDLPLPPRIMGELLDLKGHVGPEEKLFSVAGKPVFIHVAILLSGVFSGRLALGHPPMSPGRRACKVLCEVLAAGCEFLSDQSDAVEVCPHRELLVLDLWLLC